MRLAANVALLITALFCALLLFSAQRGDFPLNTLSLPHSLLLSLFELRSVLSALSINNKPSQIIEESESKELG